MPKKIFIGSSLENLALAREFQSNLVKYKHDSGKQKYNPVVWDQGIFRLSETIIESLMAALPKCDYAVFAFAPNDITKMREKEHQTVRDNVVFELGLFMGHLGRKNCYLVTPNNTKDFHLPSDLMGITRAEYDADLGLSELESATSPACNQIHKEIEKNNNEKEEISSLCLADWKITELRKEKSKINISAEDSSDLFFLMLSVKDCRKSRVQISDYKVKNFPNIHIEAMYDLLGSWDLMIKFRAKSEYEEFKDGVIKRLVKGGNMKNDESDVFGKRKMINVVTQSNSLSCLINGEQNETILYTLLDDSKSYDSYRSSRAFLYLEAAGTHGDEQRKQFLEELSSSITGKHGSEIIESICEGEKEIIIETFSTCSESNFVNHLNKLVEDVLTAHELQKFTLACYHYDESGLLKNAKPIGDVS